MRDYVVYLKDILEAITAIEQFIGSMAYDEFSKDDKTISAVTRKLEIIGEAVRHIPAEVSAKYTNIPWDKMAGMRNILIHQYFGVSYSLIWKAVKESIPAVKQALIEVLQNK
jgi:uncharacterized protein with HEPN domain